MIKLLHHSTVVVRDIEKSLHFYRDVLGFKVIMDRELSGREIDDTVGIQNVTLRMILLQVGDQQNGFIGLVSFVSPEKATFPHALVFETDNINEVYNRLKHAGEKPINEAVSVSIDEFTGEGSVKVFGCFDPDGNFVEFDQFIPARGDAL
jgi:catechol 2,3-dioxygenase-like lactoylglutathione lyase family enzyme